MNKFKAWNKMEKKELKKLNGKELTINKILQKIRENGYETDMEDVISECEEGFIFISKDAEDYEGWGFRISYDIVKNEDNEFSTDSIVKVNGIEDIYV